MLSVLHVLLSAVLLASVGRASIPNVDSMDTEVAERPAARAGTAASAAQPGKLPGRFSNGFPDGFIVPPQALRLALATLEALLGRRALYQLRPWLTRSAFLQLTAHVDSGMFDRSVLGALRTQMPTPHAVEATARISVHARWLACTVRLDRAQQWQCSDLTVLGAGDPRTSHRATVIVR